MESNQYSVSSSQKLATKMPYGRRHSSLTTDYWLLAAHLRGFTLLELLVAMLIFSVVAGASWALLDAGHKISGRGSLEATRHQAARTALRAIEADVRGAYSAKSSLDTGFIGTSGGTEARPLDSLTLVSFSNQPAVGTTEKEMDLAKVVYSVDEDARTDARGLVRQRWKRITESVTVLEPTTYLEEVASEVVGLNLRYYDGGGWIETWDSTISGTMPKAVEATVYVRCEWRGQEEIESFVTTIYLPVAAMAPRKSS